MRKNRSPHASKTQPNLYRYPSSPYWVFRKYSSEKRGEFRFSTGEEKNEAKAYKIGLDAYNRWLGSFAASGRPSTIADLGNLILEEKKARAEIYERETGRRDQTYRSAKNQIKGHIIPAFGHLRPEQITAAKWKARILEQHRKSPKHKMFNERKHLMMILNRAVADGILEKVPELDNPDPAPESGTYFRDETVRILMHVASRTTKLLILIMWKQGARPGEILQYEWDMIHFDEGKHGMIHIPGRITKTRRARKIPLNSKVSRVLRFLHERSSSPFLFPSPADPRSAMAEYKTGWNTARAKANKLIQEKKLKIRKVDGTIYSLRDTFVTNCAKRNVSIVFCAKYIDSSVKMIEKHYLAIENEAMEAIAE